MSIIDIGIPLFFIVMILIYLRDLKSLIMPTRKSYAEITIILICVIILMYITYLYAKTFLHYVSGILAIFMLISMWIRVGISAKGFISMYRYKEKILWNEIEKVIVIKSKNIKVKLSGGFMEQTFSFKRSDYNKVTDILRENLPVQAQLEVIYNK